MTPEEEQKWLSSLQKFLNKTLMPILPEKQERWEYLSSDAMIIWAEAFTHVTYDSNFNYERIESLGDAILKTTFVKYIFERFPYAKSGDISRLNNHYMNNLQQSKITKQLDWSAYLRGPRGINLAHYWSKVGGDLFESFFGALYLVSEKIIPGLGMINCFNMIKIFYDNKDIEIKYGLETNAKTAFIEIFNALVGPGSVDNPRDIKIENLPNGILRGRIEITSNLRQILAKLGKFLPQNILASGTAKTKDALESKLFSEGLEYIARYDIDKIWIKEYKLNKLLQYEEVKDYIPAFRSRLEKEGYEDFNLKHLNKLEGVEYFTELLIGIQSDGTEVTLAAIEMEINKNRNESSFKYRRAEVALIIDYATYRDEHRP